MTVCRNRKGEYGGFHCVGHAEYGIPGEDIVCAAVSVLVINTVNSIERLTGDRFHIETEQESGRIDFSLEDGYSGGAQLLLGSMVLGLEGIQEKYGAEYVSLRFEEV